MAIPSQSGVAYIINGVCHTLANRILYSTGLTVEGAAGYWIIQGLYGVYGTMVPKPLLAPLIPGPVPGPFGLPLPVPNPFFAAAAAATLAINKEWSTIRGNCAATLAADAPAFLQQVSAIHEAPLATSTVNGVSAETLFAVQQELYARHMQEIRLTIEHRGAGIDQQKLDALESLWEGVHKPEPVGAELATAPVEMTEADTLHVANYMNGRAAEILKEVIAILGPEDFEKFHGHSPDVPFLVVDPDILKGAATEGAVTSAVALT